MEIQSRRFYSLNLCGIQTSKRLTYQLAGKDFWYLIWIFWLCWLSPKWRNVDCSQLMSWFDCYQLQLVYPTRKHGPGRNLQQETLQTSFDMFDQSQHLLHTLEKSFFLVFQLHFYFSWNNKAYCTSNGKDTDAGRDWGQEEKGMTEDEMAWWHHQLDGHEFEWFPGVGDGQGGLACCNSWSRKESDTTERLNGTELIFQMLLLLFHLENSNGYTKFTNFDFFF